MPSYIPVLTAPAPVLGAPEAATGETTRDRLGRMVAPVMVNGQGPFRFIVDTGANRSVVSRTLADRLGLVGVGEGNVHTVQGVTIAPLVEIASLSYRDLTFPSEPLPVLGGSMLAGEQGLLGVDGMLGRRLRLDFDQRCIEIVPSRSAPRLRGPWTELRGELRFGHLVVVRGRIANVRVNVLIDTGSNTSIGNRALHEQLRARARRVDRAADVVRLYTAGEPILLDTAVMVPRLDMNGLSIQDMLLYIGDFHVFSLWGMENEPTLLVGMDVLQHVSGIAIDYGRATVHFRVPTGPRTGSRLGGTGGVQTIGVQR